MGKKAIKKPVPHQKLRSFIARKEGSDMAKQDASFNGDAVAAKYNELDRMYPGLMDLPEEERDAVVSAYYNTRVDTFNKRFRKVLRDHIKHKNIDTFNALGNAIRNRWQIVKDPSILRGIKRRTSEEYNMFNSSKGRYIDENKEPVLQDLYYQQWKQDLPQNLQKETPTYDLRSAYKAGVAPQLEDDGYYHMSSRNPDTGQYFKSALHPTTLKALVEDYLMGYQPQQVGGRLGSQFEPVLNNIQRPFQIIQPQYTYPIIDNE